MLGAEVQLPPDIPRPGLDCPAREGHYFWLQQVLDELLACMAGMDEQLVAQFLALDDVKQLVPRCRQFEYSHARGVAQARSGAELVDDRVVGSRQKHRQPAALSVPDALAMLQSAQLVGTLREHVDKLS